MAISYSKQFTPANQFAYWWRRWQTGTLISTVKLKLYE